MRRETKAGRAEQETFHGSNPPVECDAVLWLGMRRTGREHRPSPVEGQTEAVLAGTGQPAAPPGCGGMSLRAEGCGGGTGI